MKIDESKFKDKKEVFDYLIKNKEEILLLKKASIKYADAVECVDIEQPVNKSFNYQSEDNLEQGIIKRAIVGNTYGWMDSHNDVHMEGIFTKSIQENKNRILHLHDHIQQLDAKVGKFKDVFEQKMNWTDLGVNKTGQTTALIGLSEIRKSYNAKIYNQYLSDEINQHSVGMIYVNLFMAVNDPEYKEEYSNWNKYINKVANQEKAFNTGYFFAITEAKLKEISAVIAGSNEITPTLQPTKDTHPEPSIEKEGINYQYLIKNFKL